jgi:hypothetical protein
MYWLLFHEFISPYGLDLSVHHNKFGSANYSITLREVKFGHGAPETSSIIEEILCPFFVVMARGNGEIVSWLE